MFRRRFAPKPLFYDRLNNTCTAPEENILKPGSFPVAHLVLHQISPVLPPLLPVGRKRYPELPYVPWPTFGNISYGFSVQIKFNIAVFARKCHNKMNLQKNPIPNAKPRSLSMKITAAIFASMLVLPCAAMAQERPWDASISFGYVGTTGNTDTTTYNLEALLKYDTMRWSHNAKFQALGTQENDAARAERYYLEDKSDFNLDADQYLFGKGSYTDDRFSGFEYQAAFSTGYGRYLLRNDTFNLQGFGGVGYRQNDIINAGSEGEVILSLGENFAWEISDSSSLIQSVTSEIGDELTVTRFEIGLESNIIDRIATKINFQARNTSKVPLGNKKTDTQTSVSLVYTF